jgi:hypothetical protein
MERLPFFELEELLDSLKALNEKEEEERKKQEKNDRSGMPSMNVNSMTRQLSNLNSGSMSGTPRMPNFKF